MQQRGNKDTAQAGARLAPAWLWSSWLASRAPHELPCLDISASSRASLMRPFLRKLPVVRPARLGPSRGLELVLMKMGRTRPPLEPRCRPQAGKSGYPSSQNADNDDLHPVALPVLVLLLQNGNLCLIPWPVLAPFAPKGKQGPYAGRCPPGARLALIVMACVTGTSRGTPALISPPPREPA